MFQLPGTAPPFTRRCGLFRFLRKPTTDHDSRNQLATKEQRVIPLEGNLHARAVREDNISLVVHLVAGRHEHLTDAPSAAAQEPAGVFHVPADHGPASETPIEAVEAARQLHVAGGHQPGEQTTFTAVHVHIAEVGSCRVEAAGGTEHAGTQHHTAIDRHRHRARFRGQVPVPTYGSANSPAEGRGTSELAVVQEHLVSQRPPRVGVHPPARHHTPFQYSAEAGHRMSGGIEPKSGPHQHHAVQEILGRGMQLTLHHGGGGGDLRREDRFRSRVYDHFLAGVLAHEITEAKAEVRGHPVRAGIKVRLRGQVDGDLPKVVGPQEVTALCQTVSFRGPTQDGVVLGLPLQLVAGGKGPGCLAGVQDDQLTGAGDSISRRRFSHFLSDALGGDHEGLVTEGVLTVRQVPLKVARPAELGVGELGRHIARLVLQVLGGAEGRLAQLDRRVVCVDVGQPVLDRGEGATELVILVVGELHHDEVEPIVGRGDVATGPGGVRGGPVRNRIHIRQPHAQELVVLHLDAVPLVLAGERVLRALLDAAEQRVGLGDFHLGGNAGGRHGRQHEGGQTENEGEQENRNPVEQVGEQHGCRASLVMNPKS